MGHVAAGYRHRSFTYNKIRANIAEVLEPKAEAREKRGTGVRESPETLKLISGALSSSMTFLGRKRQRYRGAGRR